jgi:hypothetical protein
MTDMEYTLDERVVRKPPSDPVAALAALDEAMAAVGVHVDLRREEHRETGCNSCKPAVRAILAALDAAGFAVVPKETAKRDLEECLRQNGYAIDLVQRIARLRKIEEAAREFITARDADRFRPGTPADRDRRWVTEDALRAALAGGSDDD